MKKSVFLLIGLFVVTSVFINPLSWKKVFAANPPSTNLVGRWVASDLPIGAVASWADRVSAQTITQGTTADQPVATTTNGREVVRFSTGSQTMNFPAGLSFNDQNMSVYLIMRFAASQSLVAQLGGGISYLEGYGGTALGYGNTGAVYSGGQNDSAIHLEQNRVLFGARFSASTLKVDVGNLEASLPALSANTGTGGVLDYNSSPVGTSSGSAPQDFYEILVYSAPLSNTDLAALQNYASSVYGAASATSTYNIIVDGDSRASGYLLTNLWDNYWPEQFSNFFSESPTYVDIAVAGSRLSQALSGATANVDPFFDARYTNNISMLESGYNDINSDGRTAAQVYADLKTYSAGRRSAGFKTMVLTEYATNSGVDDSVLQALDTLILSDPSQFDYIVRLDQIPQLSNWSTSPSNLTYYQPDGVHLTKDAQTLVAEQVYKTLTGTNPVSYTVTGSTTGQKNTNVTLTLTASNGTFTGETITPSDNEGGGTFTPSSITLGVGATTTTIQYRRPTAGVSSITFTNTGILNNPATFTFTVPTISASPTSIIKGTAGNSVTLTGLNTSWTAGTPGTPTFTLSGGTGASITAQTIANSTTATLTITAGSAVATLVITDPATLASTTVSVVADTTPPSVTMTAPTNSATVSGSSVTLSANSSDNVGVTGVQFEVDGTPVGSSGTGSPYSITWDSTSVTDGTHTIVAVAHDAAGNSTTSTAVTVTVQNTTTVVSPSYVNYPSARAGGYSAPQILTQPLPSTTQTSNTTVPPSPLLVSSRDLQIGATGSAVILLQQYLNTHGFTVAVSGAGSAGHESAYFGALTKAALIRFQKAVGIKPTSGYFGPITKNYINTH